MRGESEKLDNLLWPPACNLDMKVLWLTLAKHFLTCPPIYYVSTWIIFYLSWAFLIWSFFFPVSCTNRCCSPPGFTTFPLCWWFIFRQNAVIVVWSCLSVKQSREWRAHSVVVHRSLFLCYTLIHTVQSILFESTEAARFSFKASVSTCFGFKWKVLDWEWIRCMWRQGKIWDPIRR